MSTSANPTAGNQLFDLTGKVAIVTGQTMFVDGGITTGAMRAKRKSVSWQEWSGNLEKQ